MALKFAANLTMLFTEQPFVERFTLAAQAGFTAVEFLFPYETGIETVRGLLGRCNLELALFNLPAGDIQAGEWGILCSPHRQDLFRRNFEMALEAAIRLGCKRLNTMFGKRVKELTQEKQEDCARRNLLWAAPLAASAGIELMVEPLNAFDYPAYFLTSTRQAVRFLKDLDQPAVRLQYDIYHAQMGEGNLIYTLTEFFPYIGHIQFADVPGRHQPGTGEINFPAVFAALENLGYSGYLGIEYKPLGSTEESLAWLPPAARAAGRSSKLRPGE